MMTNFLRPQGPLYLYPVRSGLYNIKKKKKLQKMKAGVTKPFATPSLTLLLGVQFF